MQVLNEQDIEIGGFASVRERHYVMDARTFGDYRSDGAREGLGALVYLADAHMRPGGHTGRHGHRNINIITWLIRGALLHEGSLGHDTLLGPGDVQIQFAGEKGFEHDEINPGDGFNRMIQLWLLPGPGDDTRYRSDHVTAGQPQLLYRDDAGTRVVAWQTAAGNTHSCNGEALLYLVSGEITVTEADTSVRLSGCALVRATDPQIETHGTTQLLLVQQDAADQARATPQ